MERKIEQETKDDLLIVELTDKIISINQEEYDYRVLIERSNIPQLITILAEFMTLQELNQHKQYIHTMINDIYEEQRDQPQNY